MSSYWLTIRQKWIIKEKKQHFLSNDRHLEWRVRLWDTILKGCHSRTIQSKFSYIWFSRFWVEDLNLILICIICIFGMHRLRDRFNRRMLNICWTTHSQADAIIIREYLDLHWTIKEISMFSKNGAIWTAGWAVKYQCVRGSI